MDLWCDESTLQDANEEITLAAFPDENILHDDRVLERLLQSETRCLPLDPYHVFTSVQTEILPAMRKVLTNWMLEVCEELNCSEVVFPLSVNYLDRFLSIVPVKKCHLQLLGGVCLLIASKLRQCKSLHPQDLVFFSDNSFSVTDVTDWEMLVLTTLKWDVSVVISTDFLDHLLLRLQLINDCWSSGSTTPILPKYEQNAIRRRAADLCLYCSTDFKLSMYPPSMVASACISTAISDVNPQETSCSNQQSPFQWQVLLNKITGIEVDCLKECQEQIETLIVCHIPNSPTKTSFKEMETGAPTQIQAIDLDCRSF